MDDSKHTVTIPIADYNEFMAAKAAADVLRANMETHLELLQQEGLEIEMSPDMHPTRVSCSRSGPNVKVFFNYEQ